MHFMSCCFSFSVASFWTWLIGVQCSYFLLRFLWVIIFLVCNFMQAEGWLTTRSMEVLQGWAVFLLCCDTIAWESFFFAGCLVRFSLSVLWDLLLSVLWFVFVGVGVWLCDVVLIDGCDGCCKCWCTGTYHKGCVVRTQSCPLVLIWLKCFFFMVGLPTESQEGCVVATSTNVVVDWVS